jgi:hypothetical protein
MMSEAEIPVSIRRGALYLQHDVCDLYFAAIDGVVLLRREADLFILPVRHAAAGGYLLKRRNAAGDRVVHAPDFFMEQGLRDEELSRMGQWDQAHAALIVPGLFM